MLMAWQPDYCSLADLRTFLEIDAGNTADDAMLALDITAASRAIDQHCNRQFGQVGAAELRYFPLEWWGYRWTAVVHDFTGNPSAVEVDGSAVTGAVSWPRNATALSRPYSRLEMPDGYSPGDVREVAVTALWGWSSVPVPVALACRLQASRFAARRDSPFGIAGSPDLGSEIRLLAKVDPDVAVALAHFVRPRRSR